MSAKTAFATTLVLAVVGIGTARGQAPGAGYAADSAPGTTAPENPLPGTVFRGGPCGTVGIPPPSPPPPLGYFHPHWSSWIRGDKYTCCDGIGGNGPIQGEVFFRSGVNFPLGSSAVAGVLQPGFYLGGGGRTLFFDPAMKHAWTVELGLANIANHAHSNGQTLPLDIIVPNAVGTPTRVFFGMNGVPGVTLRQMNRTFVDLGGGHEWYLFGACGCGGPTWRVGVDGGGRWGTASAEFNEIRHRTGVVKGVWAAAHTDLEVPCGCCVLQMGLRLEYSFDWSERLLQPQNTQDVHDINLLFNLGVRF